MVHTKKIELKPARIILRAIGMSLERAKIKGGAVMGNTIKWEMEYEAALARARAEDRFVFLDFHNPQ